MDVIEAHDETIEAKARTTASTSRTPVLFVRRGRGRTGGSTVCDWLIQRARRNGRRAKALDGDLRSRTLMSLYPSAHPSPSEDPAALPISTGDPDPASAPGSEDLAICRSWLLEELNQMAEDRVSRVLDLGGGDRVVQEFVQDLSLADFTARFNITLVQAFFLGPDEEDFRHVINTIDNADFDTRRTILYLNDGVIRSSQTTAGVFLPVTGRPEFKKMIAKGITSVSVPRIICLDEMRNLGLSINDVLANRPGLSGRRAPPTMLIMVEDWCRRLEAAHQDADLEMLLP
jgi:hypothetical protein